MSDLNADQRAIAKPQFELPPELINGIIEKLLAALIEKIMEMFKPKPAPPVIINPPPIIVAPPENVDPGPPNPPALIYEQWLQAGITNIYHNWFPGDPTQGVEAGQATGQQVELVRQGLRGLPPGSNIQISADPMPRNCIEFPYPAIEITLTDEVTHEKKEYILTKENPQPEGGDFWIQGGETPTSIYMRSTGHHFILLCPEPANRSSLRIRLVASNGAKSNEFGAPYFIKGDGTSRKQLSIAATSSEAASPERIPFSAYSDEEYQEKSWY